MLVIGRYLLTLGTVKHCGGRTRAAHPVISDSLAKSSSESRSGERRSMRHRMEAELAFYAEQLVQHVGPVASMERF